VKKGQTLLEQMCFLADLPNKKLCLMISMIALALSLQVKAKYSEWHSSEYFSGLNLFLKLTLQRVE
jgi:hypothetical protein